MPRINMGAYLKWKVGNDIRKLLLADADVHALVGDNIFPLVAPENITGDFIVYSRDSYSHEYVKQGFYDDTCQEEIMIVSDKYDSAVDIAEKVDKALTGTHNLDNGATITLDVSTSKEVFQDNKYIEIIIFKVE